MVIIVAKNGKDLKVLRRSEIRLEQDLQDYVYNNPEVLCISEIKGEDKRFITLVKEFPVYIGQSARSLDILGIDEDGDIYLIETKLYRNPDKRRIIAQLLEYGAGLWTSYRANSDKFLSDLDRILRERFGKSLDQKLKEDFGEDSLEFILNETKQKIVDGSFTFIILMDTVPEDLKEVLLYLNQNSEFNVYAVELEFYKHDKFDIIVPKIYGTESTKSDRIPESCNEERFFKDASRRLSQEDVELLKKLYEFSERIFQIRWGRGRTVCSFNVRVEIPSVGMKTMYSVYANGNLGIHFGTLSTTETGRRLAEFLKSKLEEINFKFSEDWMRRYPGFNIDEWGPKVDKLIKVFTDVSKMLEELLEI